MYKHGDYKGYNTPPPPDLSPDHHYSLPKCMDNYAEKGGAVHDQYTCVVISVLVLIGALCFRAGTLPKPSKG